MWSSPSCDLALPTTPLWICLLFRLLYNHFFDSPLFLLLLLCDPISVTTTISEQYHPGQGCVHVVDVEQLRTHSLLQYIYFLPCPLVPSHSLLVDISRSSNTLLAALPSFGFQSLVLFLCPCLRADESLRLRERGLPALCNHTIRSYKCLYLDLSAHMASQPHFGLLCITQLLQQDPPPLRQ